MTETMDELNRLLYKRCWVKKFELIFEEHPIFYVVTNLFIILSKDTSLESDTVSCQFFDVRNLKLNRSIDGYWQMIDLQIEDAKDWGWERVKYKCAQLEHDDIGFLCDSFSFSVP